MINFYRAKTYCNEDISLIENYDKAIADKDNIWHCHHRRELETSRKELIEIGQYYKRPALELIFLTHSEHSILHNKGKKRKPLTEETRRKIAESRKGKTTWNKGKKLSDDHKQKMSDAMKRLLWFNNGIKSVRTKSCPEGFVKGMLKQKKYEKRQ